MKPTEECLDLNELTVAEVALTFPNALKELSKHGLDFCCGGRKSFLEACQVVGVDPKSVMRDMVRAQSHFGADSRMNFASWDVPLLIDFIVQHHHAYVRETIPRIKELLHKVCLVHRDDSPTIQDISDIFNDLSRELLNHLPKEEEILFPAMRRMFGQGGSASELHLIEGCLAAPVGVMEHDHERAGELIKSIRLNSDNYTPPTYACPTFKMAYIMLQQFEDDLLQHIHIENNILFPKIRQSPKL